MGRSSLPALVVATLFVSACAAPPNKEMDQAQAAIDAARAAGAERYAATEYSAAMAALKNSNEAAAARDYRLALNHALESWEHAQNAAREAADTKAQVRAEVERSLTEIAALLAAARTRMATARRARAPSHLLRQSAAEMAAADAAVQKAGEAVAADDYLTARAQLEGVTDRLTAAGDAIDATLRPRRR